ncbi:MAG: 23S rRNA (uridine(2552)-2'-O)-methyltransferase RlmE [Xanthomonadales bacterium]|nr:Ribosomal RNA large subunit methyltransferase E [Xanthomonadales bacterium]MCC6593566.1 23S rRNA (uridine(2552)-2'-O)-methyltransferase RlmE [Xanthomonadales bacterium]MCE7932082.1 23S rRNA (uridine(2552)-2'-O)-methyltransferase RlmE [Xanthomonadales bacterium PRO6]
MARSKSSGRWLDEHFSDPYVRRAQVEGMRSRAAYKLEELIERDHLLRPGMVIVDLGAAPGGWSQVAQDRLKGKGRVIALDILEMAPLSGVEFIHGDFTQETVLQQLEQTLAGAQVDLVLSDMAPNMSGVPSVDQARSMRLAELALDFARRHCKRGGGFLVKLFQGEGFDGFIKDVRAAFDRLHLRKPKASRGRSREIYALGTGFRANLSPGTD